MNNLETWNPEQPTKSLEDFANNQKIVDKQRQEYINSLPEEQQKKTRILESAVKLLDENGIDFMLFGSVNDAGYFEYHKFNSDDESLFGRGKKYFNEVVLKILPRINTLTSPLVKAVLYLDKDGKSLWGCFRSEDGYMNIQFPKKDEENNEQK